ncbi:DUF4262 domain-containing protein [Allosphingosinicella sp.]|uniref:DUF4262 domain-containing protein n=1 Tax=Allosphingosinicella sp. TaxID=2823234 RepID=UPI003782F2AB
MSLRGKTVDNPADQRFIDMVAQHGHAVMRVSDGEDEPSEEPGFVYSLGAFESYGALELIIFGLAEDLATEVINFAMDEYVAGRRFTCGVPEYGLLGGDFPVVFQETHPDAAQAFATFADWYYERAPFPLWQIVWPGKTVGFPWEDGCADEVKHAQIDLTGQHWHRALN